MKMKTKLRVKMLSDSGLKKLLPSSGNKKDTKEIDDNSGPLQQDMVYLYLYLNLHAYMKHRCQISFKKKKINGLLTSILKRDLVPSPHAVLPPKCFVASAFA